MTLSSASSGLAPWVASGRQHSQGRNKVVVHDLHRQSAGHHLQAGAEWADTPRALAEKSDVIFTSLPEPADVERVSLGADGLIEGVKKGAAYFDLSTNAQGVVRESHEAFAARGAHMLDAPVSGGPQVRRRARWRSGSAAIRRTSTGTRACSTRWAIARAYIGPIGAATVAKLVHNMLRLCDHLCAGRDLHHGRQSRHGAPWRYGKQCARAPAAAASPSTGCSISSCPANTIRRTSRCKLAAKDVEARDRTRDANFSVPMRMSNLALRRDDRGVATVAGKAAIRGP